MRKILRGHWPAGLTDTGSNLLAPLLDKLRQADALPGRLRTWLPGDAPRAPAADAAVRSSAPPTKTPNDDERDTKKEWRDALTPCPPWAGSGCGWIPVLQTGTWNLPTAVNLAAFSALAYGNATGPGSAENVLGELRRRVTPPCRFGHLESRMVLHTVPRSQVFTRLHREAHFGVQLFLASSEQNAVLFIQGTDGLLTLLLDSARAQLSGTGGANLLEEKRPALERLLLQASTLLNVDVPVTDFLDHKASILDYLMDPANRGAHAGFMVLVGAFLHSPAFHQAILDHGVCRKQLFVTGHSLGGALALLLARELQSLCARRIHVYTYGCPRVGSPTFVRGIPHRIVHYRVVNSRDPVAWMAAGPQWKDHGRLRFLRGDAPPVVLSAPVRGHDWPGDHFLRGYAWRLRRALLNGREEEEYLWEDD